MGDSENERHGEGPLVVLADHVPKVVVVGRPRRWGSSADATH